MPLAGRAVPRTDLLKPSTTASCHRRAVSLLSMGVRKERHSTLIYSQRRRVDSCEDVVIMTFNEAVRGGRSFPFANYTHESTGQGMRGLCVHSARPLWPPLRVPLVEVRYRSLSPTSIRVGSMGTVALTFLDRLCWGMLSGIVRGQSRWSNGDGGRCSFAPPSCKSPRMKDLCVFFSYRYESAPVGRDKRKLQWRQVEPACKYRSGSGLGSFF